MIGDLGWQLRLRADELASAAYLRTDLADLAGGSDSTSPAAVVLVSCNRRGLVDAACLAAVVVSGRHLLESRQHHQCRRRSHCRLALERSDRPADRC